MYTFQKILNWEKEKQVKVSKLNLQIMPVMLNLSITLSSCLDCGGHGMILVLKLHICKYMQCRNTQGSSAWANLVAFQGGLSHRVFYTHNSSASLHYAAWLE